MSRDRKKEEEERAKVSVNNGQVNAWTIFKSVGKLHLFCPEQYQ